MKQIWKVDDYPSFLKYIDEPEIAKWFLVVLRYGYINNYHSVDDFYTLIEIEFEKLLDDNDEEAQYISFFSQDQEMMEKLRDVARRSIVVKKDRETGQEFEISYYLDHFLDILDQHHDDICDYFKMQEQEGLKNAMFPKDNRDKIIVWSN